MPFQDPSPLILPFAEPFINSQGCISRSFSKGNVASDSYNLSFFWKELFQGAIVIRNSLSLFLSMSIKSHLYPWRVGAAFQEDSGCLDL